MKRNYLWCLSFRN